jgi:hypothetical protein
MLMVFFFRCILPSCVEKKIGRQVKYTGKKNSSTLEEGDLKNLQWWTKTRLFLQELKVYLSYKKNIFLRIIIENL